MASNQKIRMTGRELEQQAEAIYRLMGYVVVPQKRNNSFDLLATRDTPGLGRIALAIECKVRHETVGVDDVRLFASNVQNLVHSGHITAAILVTNGKFSAAAKAEAFERRVVLLTLNDLAGEALDLRAYFGRAFLHDEQLSNYIELNAHYIDGNNHSSGAGSAPINRLVSSWVADQKSRMLLVVGVPGSGKSTVLRKVAQTYAGGYAAGRRIPILVSAVELASTKSLYRSLLMQLSPTVPADPVSLKLIDTLVQQGELLVLVDGLDDLPDSDAQILFDECLRVANNSGAKLVVTCRRFHGENSGPRAALAGDLVEAVELDPLTDLQVMTFLESKGLGIAAAAAQLYDLALLKRPLLLQIASNLFLTQGTTPFSATSILEG